MNRPSIREIYFTYAPPSALRTAATKAGSGVPIWSVRASTRPAGSSSQYWLQIEYTW